jgi:hypothetical protein
MGVSLKWVRLGLIVEIWVGLVAPTWAGDRAGDRAGFQWLDVMNARYGGGDCRVLPLATWRHPTRAVMENAGVTLRFVALCQGDSYPVFGVDFRYDPRTATDAYFNPLYDAMYRANGGWNYSFLVVQDRLAIDIRGKGSTRRVSLHDLPAR